MYYQLKYNIDVLSTLIKYRGIENINKISMYCQYQYNIDILST